MLDDIITELTKMSISDIHIIENRPVAYRFDGEIVFTENIPTQNDMKEFLIKFDIDIDKETSKDFAFTLGGVRFRCNYYRSFGLNPQNNGNISLAIRVLSDKIPDFNTLNLPPEIEAICEINQGLVIICGITGCGKSSTLAAIIDKINTERHQLIITLEDPVEYIHLSKNCKVVQREIGVNVPSFEQGVKDAMREDPDVILVGELRSRETISNCITLAETGHLVLTTLHARNVAECIDRLIIAFPGDMHPQIRMQVSNCIQSVVHQDLILKTGGGRVPLLEILRGIPEIQAALYDAKKTESIRDTLRFNRSDGCLHMIDNAIGLIKRGLTDIDSIKGYVSKDEL